jgi:hypothetical protein
MLTAEQLLPANTAFAACFDPHTVRLIFPNEWQIEAASGVSLPILGEMPAFCHANAMTDAALAFFEQAGVKIAPSIVPFSSEAEAMEIAKALAKNEYRFAYTFQLASSVRRAGPLLVEPALYRWLNNKANLAQLCDPRWLPFRRIFSVSEVSDLRSRSPNGPVYVKGGTDAASGGGLDVRYCPDPETWSSALDWIESTADLFTACIVEDAIPFSVSWCLNFVVSDEGVRYLGAAEQLFSAQGVQSGSLIDDAIQPPVEAVQIGYRVSARAKHHGYRGFAGYDMCTDQHGRTYFFDFNFRVNLSTNLLLFHRKEVSERGPRVSMTCSRLTMSPLEEALLKIEHLASRGVFIPTRLYDGSKHRPGGAPSIVTGILTSASRAAVADLEKEFLACFADRDER